MAKIIHYKLFINPYSYSLTPGFLTVVKDFKVVDHLIMKDDSQIFYYLSNSYA